MLIAEGGISAATSARKVGVAGEPDVGPAKTVLAVCVDVPDPPAISNPVAARLVVPPCTTGKYSEPSKPMATGRFMMLVLDISRVPYCGR